MICNGEGGSHYLQDNPTLIRDDVLHGVIVGVQNSICISPSAGEEILDLFLFSRRCQRTASHMRQHFWILVVVAPAVRKQSDMETTTYTLAMFYEVRRLGGEVISNATVCVSIAFIKPISLSSWWV